MKTLQKFYRALKRDRTTNGLLHTLVAFEERNRILGLPEIYDLEHQYCGEYLCAGLILDDLSGSVTAARIR